MTFKSIVLATLVLGASFGSAYAESGDVDPRLPVEQVLRVSPKAVVEGRQAATIAAPTTSPLVSAADQAIIDRNVDRR